MYGMTFGGDVGRWLQGMAGEMLRPYIEWGKKAIPDYQRDVDKIWNWATSPAFEPDDLTNGPAPPMNVQVGPSAPAPPPMQRPPAFTEAPPMLGGPGDIPPNPNVTIPPSYQAPGWFDNEPTYAPPPMTDSMQPPASLTEPPPDPYDVWSRGYEADTEARWHQMRQHARNNMWMQMGNALMANATDPGLAMVGMNNAISGWGQAREGLDQFRDSRDDRKMDTLYRLRQMQNLGRDKQTGRNGLQLLDDGTPVQWIGGTPYKVMDNGDLRELTPQEFGAEDERAEDRERAQRAQEKESADEKEKREAVLREWREQRTPEMRKVWISRNRDLYEKYVVEKDDAPPVEGSSIEREAAAIREMFPYITDPALKAELEAKTPEELVIWRREQEAKR
jgi:hypothetical protein